MLKKNSHYFTLKTWGASLVVPWLRLCTFNSEAAGSVPGQGTRIPHAMQRGQNKKTNNKNYASLAKQFVVVLCSFILFLNNTKSLKDFLKLHLLHFLNCMQLFWCFNSNIYISYFIQLTLS